jgi:hypothetical protein
MPSSAGNKGSRPILSLHIRHPNQDLSAISRAIGLKLIRIWKAGDRRATPKGTKLDGVHEYSYCALRFDDPDESALSARVQLALTQCKPHVASIETLISSGGSVSLAVGWFMSGSDGETFDWKLLNDLVGMKLSLEMYIYDGAPNKSD